jgi:hypothetical protein
MFLREHKAFSTIRRFGPLQAALESYLRRLWKGDSFPTQGPPVEIAKHDAASESSSEAQMQLMRTQAVPRGRSGLANAAQSRRAPFIDSVANECPNSSIGESTSSLLERPRRFQFSKFVE